MPLRLSITPLPFLQRCDATLRQAIRLIIDVDALELGRRCTATFSDEVVHTSVDLGELEAERTERTVLLPEAEVITSTIVDVTYGELRWHGSVMRSPVRRWEIHLVLHSHTDLGFTAPLSDVVQIHNENTDQAIVYCRETANWPVGSRFKWTCEVSWQVQNYIRARPKKQVETLMRLVREDAIAIGALYSGEHTELLGHEEAVRSFSFAGTLRRQYGIPCDTALLCDVPGCTGGLVQIMAKSGILNFILADNNFLAPFLPRTDLPRPFFWEGADGTEVLCWYTDHPYYAYVEGELYGFQEGTESVESKLGDKLLALEREGYPFDRFQLQYAFDNARISFRPAETVREWNAKWEYPRIVLSTAREFLTFMRSSYGRMLPRRRGDWTSWWGGIVNGFPVEESLTRQCHERIGAIETLTTYISLLDATRAYPGEELREVYDGLLAFDEHSGGGMVWKPTSREQQERALREGYGLVHRAAHLVSDLEGVAFSGLAGMISCPEGEKVIAVFNPTGLMADGIGEYDGWDHPREAVLEDRSDSTVVPSTIDTRGRVQFRASSVPAYGYKTYRIAHSHSGSPAELPRAHLLQEGGRVVLENTTCRLTIDLACGGCTSVIDLTTGRELCRDGARINWPMVYASHPVRTIELGRYIPELYTGVRNPGDFLPFPSQSKASTRCEEDPVAGARCIVSHAIDGRTWLTQEYRLDPIGRGVEVKNVLPRQVLDDYALRTALAGFLHEEGLLYFTFPFDVPGGRFECESPCMILSPEEDQFKGTCHDFTAVQRWCSVVGDGFGVVLTTPDSPLVDVGSVGHLVFKEGPDADRSTLFVRAVLLRDWGTEIESPYSTKNNLVFRFSFTGFKIPGEGEAQRRASARFEAYRYSVGANRVFHALPVRSETHAVLHHAKHTFFRVSPENVEIMTSKQAEAKNGVVLRLREVCGIRTKARVAVSNMRIKKLFRAMATEEPLEQLNPNGNEIDVLVEPFAIETFLLELEHEAQ